MLKMEYLQEKSQMNDYLQLGSQLSTEQKSENDAKIQELKHRLESKKEQVRQVSENFKNIHETLTSIKSSFDNERKGSQLKLNELKSQDEDTNLSMLFLSESKHARTKLHQNTRKVHQKESSK